MGYDKHSGGMIMNQSKFIFSWKSVVHLLWGVLFLICLIFPVYGESTDETAYYEFRSNVENASVFFDDTFVGAIEKGSLMVQAETSNKPVYHLLRIEAPGYTTYNETILQAPKPGKSNVYRGILTKLPPPSLGTVSLAVNPPGAEVYLDGILMGTVDQSGIFALRDIPAGYRIVQITLDGYQDWYERVFAEANMNTKVRVRLTPVTTGSLQVTSTPSSANVLVNGHIVGITPVTVPDIPGGQVKVTITLPGYLDFQAETSIIPGQTVPVSGTLQPVVVQTPVPVNTTPQPTPTPEPTQAPLSLGILGGALAYGILLTKKR